MYRSQFLGHGCRRSGPDRCGSRRSTIVAPGPNVCVECSRRDIGLPDSLIPPRPHAAAKVARKSRRTWTGERNPMPFTEPLFVVRNHPGLEGRAEVLDLDRAEHPHAPRGPVP